MPAGSSCAAWCRSIPTRSAIGLRRSFRKNACSQTPVWATQLCSQLQRRQQGQPSCRDKCVPQWNCGTRGGGEVPTGTSALPSRRSQDGAPRSEKSASIGVNLTSASPDAFSRDDLVVIPLGDLHMSTERILIADLCDKAIGLPRQRLRYLPPIRENALHRVF